VPEITLSYTFNKAANWLDRATRAR